MNSERMNLLALVVASPNGIPIKYFPPGKMLELSNLSREGLIEVRESFAITQPSTSFFKILKKSFTTKKLTAVRGLRAGKISEGKRQQLSAILNGNLPSHALLREVIPDPELRQAARDFEAVYGRRFRGGIKPTSTAKSKVCFARAALFCRQAGITPEQFLEIADTMSTGWRKRIGVKFVQPWMFPYLEEDVAGKIGKLEQTARFSVSPAQVSKGLRENGFGSFSNEECQDIISLAKISLHTKVESSKYEKEIEWVKGLLR